jgi:UDP-glucose 4-epimerase
VASISVTGGAGFIGSNLVKKLSHLGHKVNVVDDFSSGLEMNISDVNCQIHKVSILDTKNLEEVIAESEYVIHLAAVGSVPRSIAFPETSFAVNAIGTFNVLEIARKKEIPLIFSSSSSVFGLNSELPKSERMWMQPISPYAASKLSAESLVTSYMHSYSMKTLVLRFFNVFGPLQRSDHAYAAVIPKWIKAAMQGSPIEIYGDGSASRDFTYVEFVVDILIDAMQRELTFDTPVNVASGKSITLNQLADQMRLHFPKLEVRHMSDRLGDVKHSKNNPELLHYLFPDISEIAFEHGLSRTVEWSSQNLKRFA